MADLQTINIGNLVNDGTGDDLRTAFEKVNTNFTDLNDELTITASNTGDIGVGVFKQKSGTDLEFKRLVSGNQILVDEQVDTIVINSTAPAAFTRFETNGGNIDATAYRTLTLQGGDDITVTALGGVMTVNTVRPITKIVDYLDFGKINGQYDNSIQALADGSNMDYGTITYESRLQYDAGSIL